MCLITLKICLAEVGLSNTVQLGAGHHKEWHWKSRPRNRGQMSGFRLRGLCGTSRASAGRLRPIGLAALATCIILLSSFGSALAQTTFTSITPSSSTVAVGTPITLTANVTPPIGPTGTVGFYYEPQNFLGTANLNSSGVAVLSNVLLPVGLHLVYAIYNGDANFASSTSTPV